MGAELGIQASTVAKFLADHNPERAAAEQQRLVSGIERSMGLVASHHAKEWDRFAKNEQRTAERLSNLFS